jgi:hypothetical protein
VAWVVEFHPDFDPEYDALDHSIREALLSQVNLIRQYGPNLGRPRVDTLKGSKHSNMKELRFPAGGGVWRFAFAFDPIRRGIVFCGGDKSGGSAGRFYRRLIAKADARFDAHLARIKQNIPGSRNP